MCVCVFSSEILNLRKLKYPPPPIKIGRENKKTNSLPGYRVGKGLYNTCANFQGLSPKNGVGIGCLINGFGAICVNHPVELGPHVRSLTNGMATLAVSCVTYRVNVEVVAKFSLRLHQLHRLYHGAKVLWVIGVGDDVYAIPRHAPHHVRVELKRWLFLTAIAEISKRGSNEGNVYDNK